MNEIKKYDVGYLSSIEDVLDDAKKGKYSFLLMMKIVKMRVTYVF